MSVVDSEDEDSDINLDFIFIIKKILKNSKKFN